MFSIAETLKSGTVDELSARMSVSEQKEWIKYFEIKEKERKRNRKKTKGKTSGKKFKSPRKAQRVPKRRR